MLSQKWFALVEGQVRGPYKQEDIESRIQEWPAALIWGRGQNDWLPPEKWRNSLSQLEDLVRQEHERADRQWRLLVDGQELRPMSHDQMIQTLKGQSDLNNVRIWTEGYSEWKEVYQIHKVMDELGVSRRTHPRVPLMGNLQCEATDGNFNARILSISEGGLGATDGPRLVIGAKLKIVLKSPNLPAPLNATVEVVYVGSEGYFGMKFMSLQSESKSMIIEYIRKFQQNPTT